MTVHYLGSPRFRALDANGDPLSGGKLNTYAESSAVAKAAYTDSGGGTPHANPIILDANGEAEIWLDGKYKLVLDDAADVLQWTMDGVAGVGFQDAAAVTDEWTENADTPTHIDNTNFSVPGDKRGTYQVGRRVRASISAGTVYGTITVSAFTSVTTVTAVWDSGNLDSGLSAVAVGFLSVDTGSIPGVKLASGTDDWIFQGDVTIDGNGTTTGTSTLTGNVAAAADVTVTGRLTAPGLPPPGATCYGMVSSMPGFLLLRGQTFGSAASGATDASDDYELLFLALWADLLDAQAPVSSGRGGSAAADWAADKTMTLPDGRGRVSLGKDNMGGSSANVVTLTEADTLGDTLGAEVITIATGNLPVHSHTIAHTHQPGSFAVHGPFNSSGSAAFAGAGSAGTPSGEPVVGTSGGSSNSNSGNTGSGTAISVMNPGLVQNMFVRY